MHMHLSDTADDIYLPLVVVRITVFSTRETSITISQQSSFNHQDLCESLFLPGSDGGDAESENRSGAVGLGYGLG